MVPESVDPADERGFLSGVIEVGEDLVSYRTEGQEKSFLRLLCKCGDVSASAHPVTPRSAP